MTKSTILFLTTLLDFKKLKHILKKRKLIDFEKKISNWPGATFPGQFLIKAKLFHHATNIKVTVSESFLLKSPKRGSKSLPCASFIYMGSAQGRVFATFF